MMTLREAIEHATNVALDEDVCEECQREHKQLAEWLERLAAYEAADVAPVRHGRWEWDTKGLYPKPLCSRCSYEPYRASNHSSDLPNYCPNCGEKMKNVADN